MNIYYSRKRKTSKNKNNNNNNNNNLHVFDFNEEDDNQGAAIDKYTFLTTAASGKNISAEEISYVPSLQIDAVNVTHVATALLQTMPDSDDAFTPSKSDVNASAGAEVDLAPTSALLDNAFESEVNASPDVVKLTTDVSESEVNVQTGSGFNVAVTSASVDNVKLSSTFLDLLPGEPDIDETVEMDPDENGSMCARSSSSSDVALKEDDGTGPSSDHCMGEWELGSEDTTTVAFYPEHMVYRDSVYTDSMISFTSSFIEIEGSTVDGDDQTFKCKWGIGDILQISYHLYEGVEMVMVKMRLVSKDTEKAECISSYDNKTSTELKFAVIGSSWYEKLEAIISLNIEYKALWSSILESEDTVLGHTGVSFSKYIPNFDRPFEELVYPEGDVDAVSISKRDFDLLQPDTFVNDTIIDFYIKYLKNKIKPDERNRFHFFNSFFFRKLADLDKDPLNASEGAVAYQRVKKWTRKVNLFQKDYVFIPVNYNYHWSLVVMCHLGELATYEDVDANESTKVPCVLHMDSFRGSHIGLKGLVQSYLREEWKGRQHMASEDISSKFDNLRFIYLELPQQQNLYDCGLFLLHYVELFLKQAPLQFNPFKITENTNFLNVDWFPPAEASLKRVVIQKLIADLLDNSYQETSSDAINDKELHLSCPTVNVQKGSAVNLSSEDCKVSMHHQSFLADQGVGVVSFVPPCADDPTVALNPCFGSESFTGIHLTDCSRKTTFDENKGSLTPIEEDVEKDGQFVYSQTECGTQQDNEIISGDFAMRSPSPEMYEHESMESSPDMSPCRSEESIEIVNESSRQLDQPRSSVEYVEMVDGNGDKEPTSFMGMHVNTDPTNSLGLESDVQHHTKKMRMTEV